MTGAVDSQEGEVFVVLDFTCGLLTHGPGPDWQQLELVVSGPWELVSPGLVAQPVADKVLVSRVDQHWQAGLQQLDDGLMVGLHPVTSQKEVSVDVEVAAFVQVDLGTHLGLDLVEVQVVVDVLQVGVAQVRAVAHGTDVVHVSACLLVRTHLGVVTVDRGRDTTPHGLGGVTCFDEAQASWERVEHRLTLFGLQHRRLATLTTGHWLVVLVLHKRVGKTVTNQDRRQVE